MNANQPDATRANETRFALHQIIDTQHKGLVVSAFEYPADWQAQSEVVWNFQNMSLPVTGRARVFNPQGHEAFEFFPVEMFYHVEPDYGMTRQGENSLGQTYLRPMSGTDALARWVIPKYRGKCQNLRIVGVRVMPELIEKLNQAATNSQTPAGEGVSAKIEYAENGRTIEEEFYAVKVAQSVPYYGPQGMMTQINWGFPQLASFRAEKGKLNSIREMFWRTVSSNKINPAWQQLYAQIMQQLQTQFDQYIQMGYSQIQAAGQLSRQISANNDAMLSNLAHQRQAAAQSSHRASNASERSPNDDFSDYIRGVETVRDPYWGESQQDANYQYHWTDGQGNYQHTDDPFFNPNIGATQHWTLMEPKKK